MDRRTISTMKKQAKSLLTEITQELAWFETPAWDEMLAMTEPVPVEDCDAGCDGDYATGYCSYGTHAAAPEMFTESWDPLHYDPTDYADIALLFEHLDRSQWADWLAEHMSVTRTTLHEHITLLAKKLREMDRLALLDYWNASYAGMQIMHVLNRPCPSIDERRFHPETLRYDYLEVLDQLKRSARVKV